MRKNLRRLRTEQVKENVLFIIELHSAGEQGRKGGGDKPPGGPERKGR